MLSSSDIVSRPARRQVASVVSTIHVLVCSSNGYACTWNSPCSVSVKTNVNASSTRSVPNHTYLQPCGIEELPNSVANRRRSRLFAPSAATTRSASGSNSSTSWWNVSDTPSSRAPPLQDVAAGACA